MTRPSRAFLALTLAADLLNVGRTATRWRLTVDKLSRTAQSDGKLERLTLWKTLDATPDGADTGLSEFTKDSEAAILSHLNQIDDEPGTAWYAYGLEVKDLANWDQYPQGHAVIAYISFWKMTDEAAAADAAGTLH
ncbi:hypothetical protein AB0I81_40035 [Nonomuraea sp. NPDC050404]|uniref:hypothetical protein n=1 Tax=Nonomuraea sp. NPDC050404 TaxID=3155783 RepID=UPI0033FC83E2